jgi:hypothetical protein
VQGPHGHCRISVDERAIRTTDRIGDPVGIVRAKRIGDDEADHLALLGLVTYPAQHHRGEAIVMGAEQRHSHEGTHRVAEQTGPVDVHPPPRPGAVRVPG